MTGFDLRRQQAREFAAVVRYLDANPNETIATAVQSVVDRGRSLSFEYLGFALADWGTQYRTEHESEILSALALALTGRGAA